MALRLASDYITQTYICVEVKELFMFHLNAADPAILHDA